MLEMGSGGSITNAYKALDVRICTCCATYPSSSFRRQRRTVIMIRRPSASINNHHHGCRGVKCAVN